MAVATTRCRSAGYRRCPRRWCGRLLGVESRPPNPAGRRSTARTAIRFIDLVTYNLAPTNARQLAQLQPVLNRRVGRTVVAHPVDGAPDDHGRIRRLGSLRDGRHRPVLRSRPRRRCDPGRDPGRPPQLPSRARRRHQHGRARLAWTRQAGSAGDAAAAMGSEPGAAGGGRLRGGCCCRARRSGWPRPARRRGRPRSRPRRQRRGRRRRSGPGRASCGAGRRASRPGG
jgi:hypothetical protein